MFINASATAEWGDKGFYPVLNEHGGPRLEPHR
jgi:hypothetical protein